MLILPLKVAPLLPALVVLHIIVSEEGFINLFYLLFFIFLYNFIRPIAPAGFLNGACWSATAR